MPYLIILSFSPFLACSSRSLAISIYLSLSPTLEIFHGLFAYPLFVLISRNIHSYEQNLLPIASIRKDAQGTERNRKDAQGCAWVRKDAHGAQGCAMIRMDEKGCARVCKDPQGRARMRKDAPGCARIRKDAQGTARMRKDAQGCARVRKVAQGPVNAVSQKGSEAETRTG